MAEPFDDLIQLFGQSPEGKYVLRLYVTGTSPQSTRAIENIKRLCELYLPGRYELSVIDLYQQPGQAEEAQIVVAPTLVKSLPLPIRRLLGDLSDTKRVLLALDIPEE
jgi:circadian clock protein KaiB